MTPQTPLPYRRKLIEVALPLEAINKESTREKSIRHGHPSTLHLWWARRPLATCRAVLFASLVDDPSAWPDVYPTEEDQEAERQRLFRIIEELVIWENSNDPSSLLNAHIEIARSLSRNRNEPLPEGIEAIHDYIVNNAPPVYDPFCGGGSIPLEAQRLGLKAYGSDLNPVAVLITKALIEIPPKFAGMPPVNPESLKDTKISGGWEGSKGLAEDVRYYGQWMRNEAEKRIGHLYPKVGVTEDMTKDRPDLVPYIGQDLTVIAWIWARTVISPNPAAGGAEIPLVRSFWLSTKKGKEAWVEPVIDHNKNDYQFEVRTGDPSINGPIEGIMSRKGGRCLITNTPMLFPYIRSEAKAGRMGNRLMAIVTEGKKGRIYLPPIANHEVIDLANYNYYYPNGLMPKKHRNFQPPVYGLDSFGDLFTTRQLVALTTFSDLVKEARSRVLIDATRNGMGNDHRSLDEGGIGSEAYADAVTTYLAFAVDKATDYWSSLCSWHNSRELIRNTFGRQALPMVWDYAECCPFSKSTGNWIACVDWVWKTVERSPEGVSGSIKQINAMDSILLDNTMMISTDPPYYDNIGYSDLSDFFYVWLRRSLQFVYPSLFSTVLTPKTNELIASPYRHDGDKTKSTEFFEKGLGKAFIRMHETQNPEFPMTVYYAFKQAEAEDTSTGSPVSSTGWETMLSGLIHAGFMIIGTWPMRTELGNRMVGMGTNALASSIVLVCRPHPKDAKVITRREFLTAMKQELPTALRNLQSGLIAPVDLAQAAIGPGMAVFTRYAKTMEADGSPMTVRTALGLINQTLDEVLAEQEGEFDSDTRWAVSWFEQYGMQEGPYGEAETLSKAKNVAVHGLVEAGILTAKSGKVQLISRDQLPDDWDPKTDTRLPAWEATQHLIRALDKHGEQSAAALLISLGSNMGERARDLAYRLYAICERKKWSNDALAYNSLIISWPEIQKLAQSLKPGAKGQQKLGD